MVTLYPTTYEYAQKMANFSLWIREQLVYRDAGYEIADLIQECERYSELLNDIIKGRKQWEQGRGWILIPPMHQNMEESE